MQRRALLVILAALAFLPLTTAAADNYVGTWVLVPEKSRFNPGPGPQSQVTVLEMVNGRLREVVDRVNADGSKTHWDVTVPLDGTEQPVVGDPERDTVAFTRVDDNTITVVNKKAGKVMTRMTISVAKDGKSRTNASTGVNSRGAVVDHLLYFDRK